ncbi:MAG: FAD-dependent oxidoreductase [Chloroflexota bacterium]|nr:FAD-dependent oxidoreductase [Chloroflexota bacterium]
MDADVVVIGGGATGVAAARAAAEEGARVVLLERYGFLGGSLTASLVGSLGGLYVKDGEQIDYVVGGIARKCAETLKSWGVAFGPVAWGETAVLAHAPYAIKGMFDGWVEQAQNLRPLLHTQLCGCAMKQGRVSDVSYVNKAGVGKVSAKVFLDASGDGDLAFHAGVPMEGSPVQFPSMNFYMGNVDISQALAAGLATLQRLIEEALDTREYDLPRRGGAVIPTMLPGQVVVAMGRIAIDGRPVNCADPEQLTHAEMEGRRQARVLADFLKARMPGFSEAFIEDTPTQVGVRSTRRLVGEYVLTRDDVLSGARFDDAVCRCAWPIELHAEGKSTVLEFLKPGAYYEIPYRCLLPQHVDNLVVAGRCLSASYEAQASARVSGTAMAMGEAAGVAAAMASRTDGSVSRLDVSQLQDTLRRRGALLDSPPK